jgi:hypothetical protein
MGHILPAAVIFMVDALLTVGYEQNRRAAIRNCRGALDAGCDPEYWTKQLREWEWRKAHSWAMAAITVGMTIVFLVAFNV